MPDVTQNVIIDFITDTSKLQPAVDSLEQMGKIEAGQAASFKATNTEINKQAAALKNVAAVNQQIDQTGRVTKKNVSDLATAVKGMSGTFQTEFKKGVIDGLKQAGVSIKDFEKQVGASFGKTEQEVLSLKSQLHSMVEQLAQLKINGQEGSKQFQDLAKQAGVLKDAIGDANLQVKNFASDTSTFDGLLSLTSGIAGGFAVMQGAAALFGDENKDLQQTLLRVNAAMAVLQGLQQIQTVFQKESAAATLANTIATKGQATALAIYNFIVGTSTGLTKAFRIALASTGVGLLVIALIELIQVLKDTDTSVQDANDSLENQKNIIEGLNEVIQQRVDREVAAANAIGAAQSKITAIQGKGLQAQQEGLIQSNHELAQQRDLLNNTSEAYFLLNKQIEENNDLIKKLDNEILIKGIEFEEKKKQEALQAIVDIAQARSDAAKKNTKEDFAAQKAVEKARANLAIEAAGQNDAKILEIRASLNKKLRDIDRASREQEQKDILADIEIRLLRAHEKSKAINERTTQEEIDLEKEKILKKAQFDAQQEGLSQKQILEIKTKGLEDANKLQRDFSKQSNKEILDDAISRNNAELQRIGLSEQDKLSFKIDNIILAAQQELDSNKGLSEKIKEINANRDRAIKEARLASIRATLDAELAEADANNAPILRHLEKSLSDQQAIRNASSRFEEERLKKELGIKEISLNEEKGIIDTITGIALDANFKRIAALNGERSKGLIGQKDYNLEYKKLVEEQTKIVEDGEKKKTDSTVSEGKKRIAQFKDDIDAITRVAGTVTDILASLNDLRSQQENQKISEEREHIKELKDAGAITEKESLARMKRVDAEDRKNKREQAQRDKNLALFNAVISTAKGVAAAIPNPFLIALAIAIGAAQIAIIAARPIPRFAKGKKGSYQGLAEVGEAGSELIEKNGRMFVAEKPEIVWLGKTDKVYSHKETVEMMSKPQMSTERNGIIIPGNKGVQIDYERLGKAVGKNVQTNVYVDGIKEQQIKQQEFIKYLDARRKF